jgi:hypothetical protein
MKTTTKFPLAILAAGILSTAGALAGDSGWHAIDTHHGSLIFMSRPVESQPTFAFGGHAKTNSSSQMTGRKVDNGKLQDVRLHQVSTPHGNLSYFAPE